MKYILNNIRDIRESKGLSQEYLADQIGISQTKYARFERGASKTDLETLSLVAKGLQYSLIDILTYPKKFIDSDTINKSNERISVTFEVSPDKRDLLLDLVNKK